VVARGEGVVVAYDYGSGTRAMIPDGIRTGINEVVALKTESN
jgi:hypothetical protein